MVRRFDSAEALTSALQDLGEALARAGEHFELYVIGGSAWLLQDPRAQATGDVDVAAQILGDGRVVAPVPLPAPLERAARDVQGVHDLRPGWINSAAAASFDHLVAEGALDRAVSHQWGGLVVHVASRADLLVLKLHAGMRRGEPGDRYRRDLALMSPTDPELEAAAVAVLSNQTDPEALRPRLDEVLLAVREVRDGR